MDRARDHSPASELQCFARWFHQDFKLLFDNATLGAEAYIETLGQSRRQELKRELRQLLDEYRGVRGRGLEKAWFRVGAQWWDRQADLRETLGRWADNL